MESIYLDMKEQRLRVSPRAIEQGWVEEMEHKMKLQRAKITAAKMDVIFTIGLELRRKEEQMVEFQQQIQALEFKRKMVRPRGDSRQTSCSHLVCIDVSFLV